MAFSSVPKASKTKINKAGHLLATADPLSPEFSEALDLAEKWRACHAYPINTFQATLRDYTAGFTQSVIVAQRLKRMPTIINKLIRYPAMTLTTMQDIAGVRAVVNTVKQVYELANRYRGNPRFLHEHYNEKDYIESPRDDDGYRSLHLMYKYKNKRNPLYDGLRIEIQIRTKLQHIWATAVETMGTFLGQALKSRQGSQRWIDFFAVTSSAFAHMEKCPLVPRFKDLSRVETFEAVAMRERDLNALEIMRGFSTAVNLIINNKANTDFYHLVILNSLKRTIEIKAYSRRNFKRAVDDYGEIQAKVVRGEKVEPVLVSAGPISSLKRAYPNFFLDIGEFIKNIESIINQAGNAAHKM
jgi:hypothetical protein